MSSSATINSDELITLTSGILKTAKQVFGEAKALIFFKSDSLTSVFKLLATVLAWLSLFHSC
jgi:hypothetical protein